MRLPGTCLLYTKAEAPGQPIEPRLNDLAPEAIEFKHDAIAKSPWTTDSDAHGRCLSHAGTFAFNDMNPL